MWAFSLHSECFIWVIAEGKSREDLEAEEQEEEEEAKNIQTRLAANLSEEDYDLNFFQVALNHSLWCAYS